MIRGRRMVAKLWIAAGFFRRVRGLIGRNSFDGVMLLTPCNDIHTFGMKQPMDLAFVDGCGKVVLSIRGIVPRRRVRCKQAYAAIERFSKDDQAWFEAGDQIGIVVVKTLKGTNDEDMPDLQRD